MPDPTVIAPASIFLFLLIPLLFLLPLLALLIRYLYHLRTTRLLSTLRNRHVWIIGASRGLGYHLATVAASHGARVSISARSSLAPLHASLGARAAAVVPLDVTADWPALRAAVTAVATVAPLDIVICNAGINNGGALFADVPTATLDAVIATNLTGVARLLHLTLPHLLRRQRGKGGGVACVVSSLAAYRGVPRGSVYSATKAAVSALCEAIRVEIWDTGVAVVAVHPGFVDTGAIRALKHPKPFLMSGEQAAREVLRAVVLRKGHYGFPLIMEAGVMRLSRALPGRLYEAVMHYANR